MFIGASAADCIAPPQGMLEILAAKERLHDLPARVLRFVVRQRR
jgi:hypothetical protein